MRGDLGREAEAEGVADVLAEQDGREGADAVELDVEVRCEPLPRRQPPPANEHCSPYFALLRRPSYGAKSSACGSNPALTTFCECAWALW